MTRKIGTPQHEINSECAANFATLTEQMRQVTDSQERIAVLVIGNGKPGLKAQTEGNTREIADLTAAIKELNNAHKLEIQARETETRERRADNRKWWMGLATTLITAILAVIQTVVIALTLANLR